MRDCAMNDFRKFVNEKYGTTFKEGDYWSLHAWSIANAETINQFWNAIWDFSGVIGDKRAQPVRSMVRAETLPKCDRLIWL